MFLALSLDMNRFRRATSKTRQTESRLFSALCIVSLSLSPSITTSLNWLTRNQQDTKSNKLVLYSLRSTCYRQFEPPSKSCSFSHFFRATKHPLTSFGPPHPDVVH